MSLQGVPNDSTCGNQNTILEQHASVFVDCEMEGEERKDQNQGMIQPYLFQEVSAQNKEILLHSEERKKSVHPYVQSTSDFDVSLHGGIPPRRPLDLELEGDILPFGSSLLYSRGLKTLEESSTAQRFWDRLKEEGDILQFSATPTLTICTALTEVTVVMEDGTFMVQGS